MTMQDKNTATGELSYFETTLLLLFKGKPSAYCR